MLSFLLNKRYLIPLLAVSVLALASVVFYYTSQSDTSSQSKLADSSKQATRLDGRVLELEGKIDILTDSITKLIDSGSLQGQDVDSSDSRLSGLEKDMQNLYQILNDQARNTDSKSSSKKPDIFRLSNEERQLLNQQRRAFVESYFQKRLA